MKKCNSLKLLAMILVSLVLNFNMSAQDIEPNNNIATASSLALNGSVSGDLFVNPANDADDFYEVIATENGSLTASVDIAEGLSVRLRIYNAAGSQLAISGSLSGPDVLTLTENCLPDAIYYIWVERQGGAGSYTLSNSYSVPSLAEDLEPNDAIVAAQTFLNPDDLVTGHLGFGLDNSDFFGLLPGDDGNITVTANFDETMTARLRLFYKSGTQISITNYGTGEISTTGTCLANDTIYIWVDRGSGCGSYDLLFEVDTPPNHDQDVEPNNSIATANVFLSPNETAQGRVGYIGVNISDNDDFYGLLPGDDGNITVTANFDETMTARLRLFYKSGTQISITNYGTGEISTTGTCLANDTIFIWVERGSGCGSYDLLFEVDTPPTHDQDVEPNNSIATANVFLSPNETAQGRVGYVGVNISDNDDFYGLLPGDDGNITVTANFDETMTARLRLFYKSGTQISITNYGTGEISTTGTCLANDTIYIWVERGSGCGSYDLLFEVDTPPAHDQDMEPNNSIATANVFLEPNQSVQGRQGYIGVNISDNADFYGLLPGDDGSVTITANFDSTMTARLRLFYKSGTQISISNFGTGEISTTGTCLANDTIYIWVDRGSGCGSYDLLFETTPPTFDNDVEPNNTVAQATPLLTGEKVQGHLSHVGVGISDPSDFYSFEVFQAPFELDAKITMADGMNARLRLLNGAGTQQVITPYSTESLNMTHTITTAGTYYIWVDGTSSCGSYLLGDICGLYPTVEATPPGPIVKCPEEAVQLNATSGLTAYSWFNGNDQVGNLQQYPASSSGDYSVIGYDINGCPDTSNVVIISALNCDDGNACTIDSCFEGDCVYTPVDCDDGNACTIDSCDLATGCVYTDVDCDDNDASTTDSCDPLLGCVNTPIGCDDGDACTLDTSDPVNGCVNTPIDCNDDDACTIDSCDPAIGCVYTDVDCDDNDASTTDSCDPSLGCVNTPAECDDGDACTLDTSDPVNGCVNTPIDCNDDDACTIDSCDPAIGCVYTDVDCDDNDASTTDSCDPSLGCVNTPVECDDGDACTLDTSNPFDGCINTPIDCDDFDACTLDLCDPTLGCQYTAIDCDDDNACTLDVCDTDLGCVYVDVDCYDNDASTTDSCDPILGCVNTPIGCDDGDACTIDTSDPVNGCVNTPIDCNDDDACTIDSCDPAIGCVYTDVDCDDGDLCTIDSCDPVIGCVNTVIDCDDGDPTTDDSCVEGVCVNTPIGGPANDLCENAEPIECGDVVDGTTNDSTADAAGVLCLTSGSSEGVFYSIIGNGQIVTANTCAFANYDTQIAVLSGTCDALVCETANDDACGLQSSVTFLSSVGVEYFIYVSGFNSATGDFTLSISCEDDCPAPVNDEAAGALPNTPDRLWGVPGWDTFDVGCATLSAQACGSGTPTSDSWYSFVAQAENQGILARANPADPNAANVDMAVEVFDATLTPLAGTTGGACSESRSCFNNAGAGEIERCVPGGLTIGDTYYYRVYDAAGGATGTSLLVDTKVKTYAPHPIVAGCDAGVSIADSWTIEDPINLYNIPPVPVFNVQMVIKDLSGAIVATAPAKNPAAPGGLTFDLAEFSPALADGSYTIHAQNEVKMMANGCVSSYWSQCGPGCDLEIVTPGNASALTGVDANWSFIAYPNPNEGDQVFISMDKMADVNQAIVVEVFDMYGKKVHTEQFAGAGSDVNKILTFDQNLSSGLYLINLTVNDMVVSKKLIVQ